MKQVTKMNFLLPSELARAVKIAGAVRGMSMTDIIIKGTESLMSRYAEKDPQIEAAYEAHLQASGHYEKLEKLIPESKDAEPRIAFPNPTKKGKKK